MLLPTVTSRSPVSLTPLLSERCVVNGDCYFGLRLLFTNDHDNPFMPVVIMLSFQIVFGNQGVLQGMKAGKGYIDMSTVDPETIADVNEVCIQTKSRNLKSFAVFEIL